MDVLCFFLVMIIIFLALDIISKRDCLKAMKQEIYNEIESKRIMMEKKNDEIRKIQYKLNAKEIPILACDYGKCEKLKEILASNNRLAARITDLTKKYEKQIEELKEAEDYRKYLELQRKLKIDHVSVTLENNNKI